MENDNSEYNVHQRFLLIDENLRKLFTLQQLNVQLLCAFIVASGNKDDFVEYVKNASLVSDINMEDQMEYARDIVLKIFETVKVL
ncbi:hypothetical protein N3740_001109 [Salmonella enterica subsp. enterica serovar Newport]|uniref:Uncharacterized protein n=1 Tax=Salmonella enterica TaxID=28901 RepID=A0A743SNE8_SALER|nr:hypothetical protein [Salmonella enterica subsp. enterica serovar Newport]MDJ7444920.1 hypothetical protein [Salmonella enterica]HAF2131446.1 hypothetical protein [Salmonella enterica]